jgi:hypothetical protein
MTQMAYIYTTDLNNKTQEARKKTHKLGIWRKMGSRRTTLNILIIKFTLLRCSPLDPIYHIECPDNSKNSINEM